MENVFERHGEKNFPQHVGETFLSVGFMVSLGLGWVRVLCFSTFYFLLFLVNVLVFTLNRYAGSAEAAYYAPALSRLF